jgi:hypothetical protein
MSETKFHTHTLFYSYINQDPNVYTHKVYKKNVRIQK